jgi:hypothetical protein
MDDLLDRLDAHAGHGLIHVVIDTPAGSGAKFKYDAERRC